MPSALKNEDLGYDRLDILAVHQSNHRPKRREIRTPVDMCLKKTIAVGLPEYVRLYVQ